MISINSRTNGSVITFYSYKGGVGRSMALANIACLLAKKGSNVLTIDWDLEAPGLHHFFHTDRKKKGLIDLFEEINTKIDLKEIAPNEDSIVSFFEKYLNSFICKKLQVDFSDKTHTTIDLIKSGKADNKYSQKISNFDWIKFYKKFPSFFRIFATYLESQYDYILIDSRTGLSDTSGICTMLMPEKLILVFAPNDQNIEGVVNVASQAIDYRLNSYDERNLSIYPLPSRIDSNNIIKRPEWLQKYTEKFQEIFIEKYFLDECNLKNYFEKASIRYIHDYAFGEDIPVLSESLTDNKNISNDYSNFLNLLEGKEQIWDLLNDSEKSNQYNLAQKYFQEALNYKNESDFPKAIDLYRKSLELQPNSSVYNNLGILLSFEATKTEEDNKKELLYLKSLDSFKNSIEVDKTNLIAHINCSLSMLHLARLKDTPPSYYSAISFLKYAINEFPEDSRLSNILGTCLFEVGVIEKNIESIHDSIKYYKIAIKNNPQYAMAYYNWGNSLYALYQIEENTNYLKQFNTKIKKALSIDSDLINGYEMWGEKLFEIAKTSTHNRAKLLNDSKRVLISAKKINKKSYLLACCYALLNNKNEAFDNLKDALILQEVDILRIKRDNDIWTKYTEDNIFKNIVKIFKN